MNFSCPVCFYDRLPYPPRDYHICPCCGTEFENDDASVSHEELLHRWIREGAKWFDGTPPQAWDPWSQLIKGGRPELVPQFTYNFARGPIGSWEIVFSWRA